MAPSAVVPRGGHCRQAHEGDAQEAKGNAPAHEKDALDFVEQATAVIRWMHELA